MTRTEFETIFSCTTIQFGEFDGETLTFSALSNGVLHIADSLELLASALTESRAQLPMAA